MSARYLEDQHQYPLCLSRGETDAYDLRRYHEDLETWASDLFVADETICHVELREYVAGKLGARGAPDDSSGKRLDARASKEERLSAPASVSTAESLLCALDKEPPHRSTRVYSIHRANSWSRMQITPKMFRILFGALKITPRMIDLLRGMHSRSAPGDEHFISCYYSIHGMESAHSRASNKEISATAAGPWLEVCYNLRYFERHGRNLKDPWSCRQTVFHHKHVFVEKQSSWIVVNPLERWQNTLNDAHMDNIVHPLSLHLRSLSSAIANKWEYLEHLSSQLLSLDKRAAFPKPVAKFDFDFTLSQQVHAIRKRLHRVKTILNGTLKIVGALSSLNDDIHQSSTISKSAEVAFIQELRSISRELEAYNLMTDELLSLSSDIKSTINSVIDFRNQEILNSNGAQLKQIAEDSSRETRAMAIVANHTYADSRTMRIVSIIALIYLPASLVFSFFSTIFVDIRPPTAVNSGDDQGPRLLSAAGRDGTKLVVYSHIWIAIVSMLTMSFVTTGWLWAWDRKRQQYMAPRP